MAAKKPMTENTAVIFGVTGLVGKELAKRLLSTTHWKKVYGIARRSDFKPLTNPNFHFISCDLLNPKETEKKLSLLHDATHLFWITWASNFPFDSQDCCHQNKIMMETALNSILPVAKNLRHVSLQTGMKHYVSLTGFSGDPMFFNEEDPRSEFGHNFYYVLEDLLEERLLKFNVSWNVLRPGLILGSSNRTFFNFMGSLCVYGAICKKLRKPFLFGGSKECWEEVYIDGSDARLVAEQHVWVATNDHGAGGAFNSPNGSSFTWKRIWTAIGRKFGIEEVMEGNGMLFCKEFCYVNGMGDKGKVWKEIVKEEGLVVTKMEDLANWGFLDSLFRCPVKMVASRDKVDQFGFNVRYKMLDSILYWVDVMRNDKLIPFP